MEIVRARYTYKKGKGVRHSMRRIALLVAAFLFVSASSGYSYLALTKDLPTVSAAPAAALTYTPTEPVLPWPETGQSAIGSLQAGVLAASSEDEKAMPIASMTKVVTALAVMQKAPFAHGEQGATYTIDATDVSYYNTYVSKFGSVAPVRLGQTMTQYQALQALLLPSGNNIADSLVRWIFGSMDEYLLYANSMVDQYGMQDTVIADASGFSPNTISTPSDMIILGQKALNHPVIAEISAQTSAIIPTTGTVRNTNRLLQDGDVIGIKTGTTDEAGNCLLFAGTHVVDEDYSVTVIGVVMGAPNYITVLKNSRDLLDAAYSGFGKVELAKEGTIVGSYSSPWGDSVEAALSEDISVYGWKGTPLQAVVDLGDADTPVDKGTSLGSLQVTGSTKPVSSPVIANESIEPPGIFWRLRNYF